MHRRWVGLVGMLVLACMPKQPGVIIAGSTSVQPFVEKLADEFLVRHPGKSISIQGGGSTAGIQATINGTCNIGTSSRNLKENENSLRVYPLCYDGIAVIVHVSSPVTSLSLDQIRRIFLGEITNWREVGGDDRKIIPVSREEGSGTRAAFEEMIMNKAAIDDACLVQDSNGAVREIIALTPQGIGYISAGLVDDRVKALAIDGVHPSFENIACGDYKIVRPFLLLTRSEPAGLVKEFIAYAGSPEGQKTLKLLGLIPPGEMKCPR